VKISELDARFVRRRVEESGEVWEPATYEAADGVIFLCPKCFQTNGGKIGTHSVICWRPRVPPEVDPKPGRWEFSGGSLESLTLVAGSSSVLISAELGGCGAHFNIRDGAIA
jgi:hypothetical protein